MSDRLKKQLRVLERTSAHRATDRQGHADDTVLLALSCTEWMSTTTIAEKIGDNYARTHRALEIMLAAGDVEDAVQAGPRVTKARLWRRNGGAR